MTFDLPHRRIVGPRGELIVPTVDEITPRLLMLIEGECELGAAAAAERHGLTRQRYYQVLNLFEQQGAPGSSDPKTRAQDQLRSDR